MYVHIQFQTFRLVFKSNDLLNIVLAQCTLNIQMRSFVVIVNDNRFTVLLFHFCNNVEVGLQWWSALPNIPFIEQFLGRIANLCWFEAIFYLGAAMSSLHTQCADRIARTASVVPFLGMVIFGKIV